MMHWYNIITMQLMHECLFGDDGILILVIPCR